MIQLHLGVLNFRVGPRPRVSPSNKDDSLAIVTGETSVRKTLLQSPLQIIT